jgi:hypothetical protein
MTHYMHLRSPASHRSSPYGPTLLIKSSRIWQASKPHASSPNSTSTLTNGCTTTYIYVTPKDARQPATPHAHTNEPNNDKKALKYRTSSPRGGSQIPHDTTERLNLGDDGLPPTSKYPKCLSWEDTETAAGGSRSIL